MMNRKLMNGTRRTAALFAAVLLTLTGCEYSLNGTGGQNAQSGQMTEEVDAGSIAGQNGDVTGGQAEEGQDGKTAGASKDVKPVIREIYDIMTVPYMRLQAYGDNAETALDQGVEKIHSIYGLLSTGDPDSEIGKLNESGSGVLGEDAAYLLETSLRVYEETDGAFDISVYPLMELWGFTSLYESSVEEAKKTAMEKTQSTADQAEQKAGETTPKKAADVSKSEKSEAEKQTAGKSEPAADAAAAGTSRKVPTDAEIKEALKKVDASKIVFDPETREITLPDGMKIDFGGIAKGYASQSVADILRENGITSALMDLGGNIQTVGRKPDGSKWRIALNDRNKGGFLGILTVEDCAVITSGGYERKFEDAEGNVYFHILDPETGYPADNGFSVEASVTIVCNDGTMADALSTAMFVLGPDKAIEYWKEHSDEFQMIIMTDEDEMYVTEGIADDYQSDYSYEVVKA